MLISCELFVVLILKGLYKKIMQKVTLLFLHSQKILNINSHSSNLVKV